MANTFVSASLEPIPTTSTTVYTCPGSTTAIVNNLQITNIDSALAANVTIHIFVAGLAQSRTIANLIPVPFGSAVTFDKPFNLAAGDRIDVTSSNANRLSAFLSILQIA